MVRLMHCSVVVLFFKQKTAYEMRISDWSSDVCSSDLQRLAFTLDGLPRKPDLVLLGLDAIAMRARLEHNPAEYHGFAGLHLHQLREEIGRASCRERVCQYV